MFRKKSSQTSFTDQVIYLYPNLIPRLEKTWAGSFRKYIYPLLLDAEKTFAKLYSEKMGAPNIPIATLLGILILKEFFNLTDKTALDEFEYNTQWHYALDTPIAEGHICEKTLFNFRNRIMDDESMIIFFNDLVKAIIEKWSIKTGTHRLDATIVMSNMKILSRMGLFVSVIEGFLKKLKKEKPGVYENLDEKYKERYVDREGYFPDVKPSKSRRRLRECARDLLDLINYFLLNKKVKNMPSFKIMERLLDEQVNVSRDEDGKIDVWLKMPEKKEKEKDSEGEIALKNDKEIEGDSLQNPSDPDATHNGHGGTGFKLQITETCDEENAFQVIDYAKVGKTNESDQNVTDAIHDELNEKGIEPETTFADGGYNSGENILNAKDQGIDLIGPVPGKEPENEDCLDIGDFEYSDNFRKVEACPEGHEPIEQKYCEETDIIESEFDAEKCEECPHKEECPAGKKKDKKKVKRERKKAATAKRRRESKSKKFKEKYKTRSGIEATISHLKNDHGMRRLPVRGSPRVKLSVIFKIMAINVKRVVNYALKPPQKGPKTAFTATV